MKLYTAKEISVILDLARLTINGEEKYTNYELFEMMTPIELPSDEEIHKRATNYSSLYYEFRAGAKWVIEQIKSKVV